MARPKKLRNLPGYTKLQVDGELWFYKLTRDHKVYIRSEERGDKHLFSYLEIHDALQFSMGVFETRMTPEVLRDFIRQELQW